MSRIKEQTLRELGDQGADTLERYFAQVEYTAYWCIRMLIDAEGIRAVIPEGGEDIVVFQQGIYKLYQIKTRDESQNPWTTAEVLPILCKQYQARKIFSGKCRFYFVSDRTADTKTALGKKSYGALYRLKFLLDLRQHGQILNVEQKKEIDQIESILIPAIQKKLKAKNNEIINDFEVRLLLENTCIETDNRILRNPKNELELESALLQALPGIQNYTVPQLKEIYDRLILLIVRKIISGSSIEDRLIEREDILNCRVSSNSGYEARLDLDRFPGNSLLEKKALLGGFDPTEISRFRRQKLLAERTIRRLKNFDLNEELEHLTIAILDHHGECRHKVCREQGISSKPGPKILSAIRNDLPEIARKHASKLGRDIDDQFCLGVLWKETNECSAWWHGLDGLDQEAIV